MSKPEFLIVKFLILPLFLVQVTAEADVEKTIFGKGDKYRPHKFYSYWGKAPDMKGSDLERTISVNGDKYRPRKSYSYWGKAPDMKGSDLERTISVNGDKYRPRKFHSYWDRSESYTKCPADRNEPWTHRGENGPKYWGETYRQCYGKRQSPIDIDTSTVVKNKYLRQLKFVNYDRAVTEATIQNDGHTVQVTPEDDVERTISVNGETYRLRQLHFHWGKAPDMKGSEHTIDGKRYQMEMHLVHMNENDDTAVVGIFFKEQNKDNKGLKPLVDQLYKVKYKDAETELSSDLDLSAFLPANPASFYRYNGSLTTPECDEGVTWSVVPNPVPVGTNQMEEFRKLYSATKEEATPGCILSGNSRPVQKLNGREVQLSQLRPYHRFG